MSEGKKENLKLVFSAIVGLISAVWLGWAGIFVSIFVFMMLSDTRRFYR